MAAHRITVICSFFTLLAVIETVLRGSVLEATAPVSSGGGCDQLLVVVIGERAPAMNTPNRFFNSLVIFALVIKYAQNTRYKAGVVEYFYDVESSLDQTHILKNNLKKYLEIVETFSHIWPQLEYGLLVFPECGLMGLTEDVSINVTVPAPHLSNTNFTGNEVIDKLSKAATKHSTWLVVNLVEGDGNKKYNTDVVFRSNGTIAAKYRKYNLFGESVDKPEKPDPVSFTTDFGVSFGLFTCFDILFARPALELVGKGIKNFIFPTAWFSELPFLTAIQYQKYWAWSNNATLLASGLSYSNMGCTGSGIYVGRSGHDTYYQTTDSRESHLIVVALDMFGNEDMTKFNLFKKEDNAEERETRNLIANVPTQSNLIQERSKEVESPSEINRRKIELKLKQEPLSEYSTSLISPKDCSVPAKDLELGQVRNCTKNVTETLCNHGLCCNFAVTAVFSVFICDGTNCDDAKKHQPTTLTEDDFSLSTHRLAVFNGVRSFVYTTGGVQTCAVVSCSDDRVSSCGSTPTIQDLQCLHIDGNYTACVLRRYISRVKIEGQFSQKNGLVTPNILLRGNDSVSNFGKVTNDFRMSNDSDYFVLEYNVSSQDTLGTAAIWGRVFDRDGKPATKSSATSSFSVAIVVGAILAFPVYRILSSH